MTDRPPSAATLFAEFLARQSEDEPLEFEVWVRAYPDLDEELRELHRRAKGKGAPAGPRRATHSFFRRQFSTAEEPHHEERVPEPSGRVHRVHEQIGDYRLIEFLGVGGMGEVWKAEQLSLGRAVALKLILPNRVDAQSLEHLVHREARAGGLSAHPNVVTTLAVGTERGMPWIAQELIDGSWTLKDFLDDLRAADKIPSGYYRLAADFVAQLADGLQAAHEGGVIHRDVKPQNVLIGPDDRPKLADFGLARVEGDSVFSRSGDFAGTYAYMSPEQVTAKRMGLDHRTDIFSLGIVLYEMLALRRPFEGDTTHQIATRIITYDPPDPSKVRSQCPRELAVIAAKALEKDPDRRYQTMAELAADLRRQLANEPILARPMGRLRRAHKWTLRNPTKSTAAAIGLLSLVIISGLLLRAVDRNRELNRLYSELEIKTEEVEVEKGKLLDERDRLAKMVAFQEGLFDELKPDTFGSHLRLGIQEELVATLAGRGSSRDEIDRAVADFQAAVEVINFTNPGFRALRAEILEPVQLRLAESFGEDPLTRAALQSSIADAYLRLGIYDAALELKRQSLELRREALGAEAPETLASRNDVGMVLHTMGDLEEALPYYEGALEARRRVLGGEDPATLTSLHNLGSLLAALDRPDEALVFYEEALTERRRILGADDRETLATLNNLGTLFWSLGEVDRARSCFQEALERKRRVLGNEDADTLTSINNMGALVYSTEDWEATLPYYEEALAGRRSVLGDKHPDTLTSIHNMGVLLHKMEDFEGAELYFQEALRQKREVLGPQHPSTLKTLSSLGNLYESIREFEQAQDCYDAALRGYLAVLGGADRDTLDVEDSLGFLLVRRGEFQAAQDILEPALERAVSALERGDTIRAYLMQSLQACYLARHKEDPEAGFDQLAEGIAQRLAEEAQ